MVPLKSSHFVPLEYQLNTMSPLLLPSNLNSSGYRTSQSHVIYAILIQHVDASIRQSRLQSNVTEVVSDRAHTRTVSSTILMSHVYLEGGVKAAAA